MKLKITVKTEREDRRVDDAAIRNWAWRNGFQPFDRGQVPWVIVRAFNAAHAAHIRAAAQEAHERFLAEHAVFSLESDQVDA